MEFFRKLYALLRHLGEDQPWRDMIGYLGPSNLYIVLFAIVFAETGLVVTPVLPGDSLLFALGAVGRRGVGINLPVVTVLLMLAAVLGDAVNYWIGYRVGPRVFTRESSWLLNKRHLLRAHEFYEKYGGKTIILARFVPIVRTFAPFVAGVGKMNYFRFALYNLIGGVAWVLICVLSGYAFGSIPFVKQHFEMVIVGVVIVSVLPMAVEFIRARRKKREPGRIEAQVTATPAAPAEVR
jgi:membrane-associated protein